MESIKVDKAKCSLCGLCAKVCPRGLIIVREGRGAPLPVLGFKTLCIKCGHCVAVCPNAAISIPSMSPDDCPPIHEDGKASPEQIELFMKSRRSIRAFKPDPVPEPLLKKALEIAGYAPTGLNLRPVRWTVFAKPSDVKELASLVIDWMREILSSDPAKAAAFGMDKTVKAWEAGGDPVLRNAPHLFLAHAKACDGLASGAATITLAYLELAAHSLGIGACWAGYFHMASSAYAPLKARLALPEEDVCLGAMMAGFPAVKYARVPLRPELPASWR